MRLAVCALSAVLLSGCSWLGTGGQSAGFGQSGGAYGVNCAPSGAYGGAGYGADAGCGFGGGYDVSGAGYGAGYGGYGAGAGYGAGYAGYDAGGFGPGAGGFGAGAGGFGPGGFGAGGFGPGGVGAGGFDTGAGFGTGVGGFGAGAGFGTGVGGFGTTTLGAAAPFGSAVGGNGVVGTQFSNGQFINGAGVQTVQGAPIFVPQPFPSFVGVPQLRGVGGGIAAAALPFGLGLLAGTEFNIGGDLTDPRPGGRADGGGGFAAPTPGISYDDAFGDLYTVGGTAEYDISRDTTLLGTFVYGEADGNSVENFGAFTPGTFDSQGNFTATTGPGSATRNLTGEFSDLETYTIEGGVRKYVGYNNAFRPYVTGKAGARRNNSVTLTQVDVADGSVFNESEFIDSGWNPTAAGLVGAEVAVGQRGAIGIESGIRWTDGLDVAGGGADDQWSIPLNLRGRVAF